MKILAIGITFTFILLLPARADTVYLRIMNPGSQPVQLKCAGLYPNSHRVTDNKLFERNSDLVLIDYRTPDADHIYGSDNSHYRENRQLREIGSRGFVTYLAESSQAIHDMQIELSLNREAVKNGITLEVSREGNFEKARSINLDTARFFFSGNHAKLDVLVDFSSMTVAYNGEFWGLGLAQSTYSETRIGNRFGMAEAYWYGYVKPFFHNAEVDYWKYNSSVFFLDGKLKQEAESGYFGADLLWMHKLEKGYEYTFTTVVKSPPDYILINNEKLVWQKEEGFFTENSGELVFYYTPDKNEIITISYIKNATNQKERLYLDGGNREELYCSRRISGKPARYRKRSIEKEFIPIDHKTLTLHPWYHNEPVPVIDMEPLKDLPYPSAEFHIMPRGAMGARNQVFDVIEKLKMDHAVFSLGLFGDSYFQPGDYTVYQDAGVKHMDFLVFEDQDGKIAKINPHWYTHQLYDDNPLNATSGLIKGWLELDESHTAFIHLQEVNSLTGRWGKDLDQTSGLSRLGHTDLEDLGVPELLKLYTGEISSFLDRLEKRTGYPDRVKRLLLPDRAALNQAYWAASGADIIVMKNIHRQSVNLLVSGGRGMADAYGIEYGFDLDIWDRETRFGYHPGEFDQIYRVYFHSGGKYLIEEGQSHLREQGIFTKPGVNWMNMARYARSHPPLGEQLVQVAVMRGWGDEWHTVAGPGSAGESKYYSRRVEGVNYLKDYNLLDILLADYGTYWNTAPDRLCTGTPYGPVDFIPWEAPPDVLNKYKFIAIMGFNTLEEEQIANLTEWVRQGGTLICAAGQVKSVEDSFHRIEELFGVVPGAKLSLTMEEKSLIPNKSTLEYTVEKKEFPYYLLETTGVGTEVLETLSDQSPLLVKNCPGKGIAYLFAGLTLTEFGEELPRKVMEKELEKIRPLGMLPFSDRIEYMVRRKGNSIVLPVFNHGNAGFPSGKFRQGVWSGKLVLEKEAYGMPEGVLAVYRAVYDKENNQVDLLHIPSVDTGKQITFETSIGTFEEYIIGPESQVQEDFYR